MGTVHWVLTDPGRRALIIDKGHPNGDLSTLPTSFKASLTSGSAMCSGPDIRTSTSEYGAERW